MIYRFSEQMVSEDSHSAQELERFADLLQEECDLRSLGVDVELVADSDVVRDDDHYDVSYLIDAAWDAAMERW